jgi:hypothetical protein
MKFLAEALALSFVFVVLSMMGTLDSVESVVSETEDFEDPMFLFVSEEEDSMVPVVSEADSIESSEVVKSAYVYGFDRGQACFRRQMGEDVEIPSSSRYVTEGHWSEEEVSRGYVDGYHRATETFSCPGSCPGR